MDEALDQQATIVIPPLADQDPYVTKAHDDLARNHDAGAICTVPLRKGTRQIGAITLERPAERPFDPATVEVCEALAAVTGPILEVLRREDRWLGAKAVDALRDWLGRLVGPRHVGLKLATFTLIGLVAFFVQAKGDYRVSAKTLLEGQILRAVVAPFDGYIASAHVRAGDLVLQGQQLCTLDDRELRLERLKWLSQFEQFRKEYSQALAKRDAAQVEILTAQLGQARAQLTLLEDQLGKTRLVAQIDGVVVTGDLSQKLGSPVQRGEVLFEVAPLDAYRVVLQVDERDIDEIQVGQSGQLLLSTFPNDPLRFTVEKVTPVSEAKEGRNYFRVEASLATTTERLRPGMEGIGKIEVDRRLLIWIWTHEVLDWFRLTLWKWLP
jgi:biotin carboxyl carrier protein